MAEGSALKAMVSFFTIWQQDLTEDDMEAMNRKFHLAPVAGALLAAVVLVVSTILILLIQRGVVSVLFSAVAILATVYVGSRFLHFDGLADFGDGSVAVGTQEDHVRALKDTLIGAGGLGVALIVTLFNVAEYTMAGLLIATFAPVTEILVKNAQVAAAAFGTPGNGMASRQVSETNIRSLEISTVFTLVLALVFATAGVVIINTTMDFFSVNLIDVVWSVLLGVVMSVVTGYLIARRANRVFGMVNGDILGATNEISRAVVMFFMVALILMW